MLFFCSIVMVNVDSCVMTVLVLALWSPGTGAEADVSLSAQCCASSDVEQVPLLQQLCSHVLTRDLLAEMDYQACAPGAFLSMLSSLHGFQRLHPKCWPGKPGSRLETANLW